MKKLLLAGLILAAIGGGIAYKMYNKEHVKAAEKTAEAVLTVDSMINMYLADNKKADAAFLNKVVELNGTVSEAFLDGKDSKIRLKTSKEGMTATFTLSDSMPEADLKAFTNKEVKVKGFCSGFNYDPEMADMGGDLNFNQSAIIK